MSRQETSQAGTRLGNEGSGHKSRGTLLFAAQKFLLGSPSPIRHRHPQYPWLGDKRKTLESDPGGGSRVKDGTVSGPGCSEPEVLTPLDLFS